MAEKANQVAYDSDFFAWTQQQAAALTAGNAAELDWANLAEEIKSLGRREVVYGNRSGNESELLQVDLPALTDAV